MMTKRSSKSYLPFAALLLLATTLIACGSRYPLRMSEAEWQQLNPAQQLAAREKQAELDLERQRLYEQRWRELERQQRQAERLQLAADRAAGMLLLFNPHVPVCIGGQRCGRDAENELILPLQGLAQVDQIVFSADDRVGSKRNGVLQVLGDRHVASAPIDIKKSGKTHQIFIGLPVRTIRLRAMSDDEIHIHWVKVFGSRIAPEHTRFIYQMAARSAYFATEREQNIGSPQQRPLTR